MRAGGPRREIVARAGWALGAALVLWLSLREAGARLLLRESGAFATELDPAFETDVPLRVARARASLASGDLPGALNELRAVLALRPRDPEVLLLYAEASSSVADQLRFAAIAAREAPYQVASAEFSFTIAFDAVEVRAPRAAAARETAARLRAANVTEGVAEAQSEADRLEGEMRRILEMALSTHAATSPTARNMFFLEESLARAKRLAAELDAP